MSLLNIVCKYCPRNGRIPYFFPYLQYETASRLFCTQNNPLEEKPPRKKTVPIPKITLISDSLVSVTTLEEAQKLSKRRDLKLVKILDLDTKTQRPTYKLMSGREYHEEELKQREARKKQKNNSLIKGEKLLLLKENIKDHDLEVHANKVLKWLTKSLQVNVHINGSGSNKEKLEHIYNFFEKHIKTDGRILQKIMKGNDMKFQIIPPKREKQNEL